MSRFTEKELLELARYALSYNPIAKYGGGKIPFKKQQDLLNCNYKEILFGGAAGSGKTQTLWFKAIQKVNNPHYHCLICRRSFQDLALPGSLIDVAKDSIRNTDANYNGQSYQVTFPSGAIIQFGYLDSIGDCYRYKSAEFGTIIIDEASEIEPSNLQYMHSRLRTTSSSGLSTQYICATNPGGCSHQYLYDRFISNPVPNSIYIPAKYTDNIHLNHDEYHENLKKLTHIEYLQLAEGQWILDDSKLVYHFSKDNLIKSPANPKHLILSIDVGHIDSSALIVAGYNDYDPHFVIIYAKKYSKMDVTDLITHAKHLYDIYRPESVVIDAAGGSKLIAVEMVRRHNIPVKSANKVEKENFIKLMNADFEHKKILISEDCTELISEYQNLQRNKHGKEDERADNHCADAALYAYKEARHYQASEYTPPKSKEEKWEEQLMFSKNQNEELNL